MSDGELVFQRAHLESVKKSILCRSIVQVFVFSSPLAELDSDQDGLISAADLLVVLGGDGAQEQADLIIKSLSQSDRPFVSLQVCLV